MMPTFTEETSAFGIDDRLLSALLFELNIARRTAGAYPIGHPLIEKAFQKIVKTCRDLLLQRNQIVLGIARETIMLDGVNLDVTNVVYRELAKALFERGIGALVLNREVTADDLRAFSAILALKREEILEQGGIENVWNACGPRNISIKAIRYDLFSTTEMGEFNDNPHPAQMQALWEQFVRGVVSGRIRPDGSESAELPDPEIVAEIINSDFKLKSHRHDLSYAEQVTRFLRQGELGLPSAPAREAHYRRLASLVEYLSPELRRKFLSTALATKKENGDPFALDIAPYLTSATIMSALEDVFRLHQEVSPLVIGLLLKLGSASDGGFSLQPAEQREDGISVENANTLFREHDGGETLPTEDLKILGKKEVSDQRPGIHVQDSEIQLDDLEPDAVEGAIGQVLIYLIAHGTDGGDNGPIEKALADLFCMHLKTGNYENAAYILKGTLATQVTTENSRRLAGLFASSENMEEIMNGLTMWGKSVYPQIRTVIKMLGAFCVSPLLDRLAVENSMSIRRFLMDRIMEFGDEARQDIESRLNDGRWYFLRNMVIMLREINNPSSGPRLHPLLRHENDKVRQEALRTLLQMGDALAEESVIRDLQDSRRHIRMAALDLSGSCRSAGVSRQMARIAMRSGNGREEYEEREAAISALAESGSPEAMPLMERILFSRNLLAPRLHFKLKTLCLVCLEKYFSPSITRPLALRIAARGGATGRLASALLSRQEKAPA